jgi:DNA-binding transcriptional MerR regulator
MNGDTPLTLDELCARAALALADRYGGAPNDRVRDLPDRRTVRYYSTLGLLDRPTIQGRTAYYGRRHLMQLVAVKRLQANGLGLSEIQRRLLGRSEAELAKLARLPGGDAPEPKREKPPRRAAFWKEPPSDRAPPEPAADKSLQAVRLSDGVLLLLPLARTPDDFDLEALRAAAGPLLKMLATRKLIDR